MTRRLLARCVRGLEWVAAAEIAEVPSATSIRLVAREVSFQAPALSPELAWLRTVDDVFVEVGAVHEVGATKDVPPTLAERLARLDWQQGLRGLSELRPVPDRPRFDVVASLDANRSYNRYAVENALGPQLAPQIGGVFLPRTADGPSRGDPDLTVRLRVRGREAIALLRLATRPMHRRDYKQNTGAGTLHPPVAASLAHLAAPAAGEHILDPFCGDGTIVIETTLCYPAAQVTGSDLDPARVANARRNATRAGLTVDLAQADAGSLVLPPGTVGAVITNPPWNLTVDAGGQLAGSLDPLWQQVPDLLTDRGRVCLVADANLDAATRLRQLGYHVALVNPIRLAGRVSHLLLCVPAGRAATVPANLLGWRRRALAAGVITDSWS